jgi:hypothetical protein
VSLIHLSPAQLRHAAGLKEKIETLQSELNKIQGNGAADTGSPAGRGRKKISAAGIARIRAAQKARWARVKAAAPARRGPRKMSAAARAKIAAAARARWARVRAAKAAK